MFENPPLGLYSFARVPERKLLPFGRAAAPGLVALRSVIVVADHAALVDGESGGVLGEQVPVVAHVDLASVLAKRRSRAGVPQLRPAHVHLGRDVDFPLVIKLHDGKRIR